jgi:hypothetical protein
MKNRGSVRNHAKHTRADFRASDRVDGWSPMPRGAGLVVWDVGVNHCMQTRISETTLTNKPIFTPTRVFSDQLENDIPDRPFPALSSSPQPAAILFEELLFEL